MQLQSPGLPAETAPDKAPGMSAGKCSADPAFENPFPNHDIRPGTAEYLPDKLPSAVRPGKYHFFPPPKTAPLLANTNYLHSSSSLQSLFISP